MESKEKKVELLQIAIKQLIDEEKANKTPLSSSSDDGFLAVSTAGDDSGHHLLSKLLSQLETLKDEAVVVAEDQGSSSPEMEKEDIVKELKELKKLRRQNFITHCLLSAMIVLTVVWQVSEVSLILKVKNGLSNPLKILGGGFLSKFWKLPKSDDHHDGKNHGSAAASAPQNPLLTTSTVPGLRIPNLPHVEFPNFDLVHEEDW